MGDTPLPLVPQVDPLDAGPDRVSPIMVEIDAAMNLIRNNDELLTSISLSPLGPGEGGSAPVFDKAAFTNALSTGIEYVCTGNLV